MAYTICALLMRHYMRYFYSNNHDSSQWTRCVLPHVCLMLALLCYVLLGAGLFVWLEAQPDLQARAHKSALVGRVYEQLIHTVHTQLNATNNNNCSWRQHELLLTPLLSRLSMLHEHGEAGLKRTDLWQDSMAEQRKWTLPSAIFYALTVTASTGYEGVTTYTTGGRLFTVGYGLIGIPFLFITAADLGMLLSSLVTFVYRHSNRLTSRCYADQKQRHQTSASVNEIVDVQKLVVEDCRDASIDEPANSRVVEPLQLPIQTTLLLILLYCTIGSCLYNYLMRQSGEADFVYGLFFAFNAVSTVGLGTLNTHSVLVALGVIVYTLCGLAVITMCVELASVQVKAGFNKLHYYGTEMHRALLVMQEWRSIRGDLTVQDLIGLVEMVKFGKETAYAPTDLQYITYIDRTETDSLTSSEHNAHVSKQKFLSSWKDAIRADLHLNVGLISQVKEKPHHDGDDVEHNEDNDESSIRAIDDDDT